MKIPIHLHLPSHTTPTFQKKYIGDAGGSENDLLYFIWFYVSRKLCNFLIFWNGLCL